MGLLDKFKKKENVKEEKQKAPKKAEANIKVEKKETEKKETTKKSPTKKSLKKIVGDAHKILISPVVSEKSAVGESINMYTFKVAVNATKVDIKNAIAQVYGVTAKKVRVVNMEGKKMRSGRKFGRRQDWKKAMITLPKGQSINIHEGV
jgi:large subunit ribosomal protein L23